MNTPEYQPVSPIRWLVARRSRTNMQGPVFIEELKSGFERIVLAKEWKDKQNEEGLIIMSYYE